MTTSLDRSDPGRAAPRPARVRDAHAHAGERSRLSIGALGVVLALALVGPLVSGCGGGDVGDPAAPQDFVAQASDFECLKSLPKVRNLRVANKLGHLDEALALAENPEQGRQYPVGTILQLFPGEAMVKRGAGFDAANNDWEYFELSVSREGTAISKRGRDDIINMFGGQCFGCHEAARAFDFICERDHGCVKLPVDGAQIAVLQDLDPRCGP